MGTIPTVTGDVEATQLGATLTHEHIFIKNPELEQNYPNPEWDEDAMLETARAGLEELFEKGISTVVDLTVMGLGRYIPRIQRLAGTVRMNIVVATGYYTDTLLPTYFKSHGPGRLIDVPEPLESMFIRDIEEGIADTGVKAALIKVVTDKPGITPDVERVLDAAARAHQATGCTITTHTDAATFTGRLQQQFFRERGVEMNRVVIGHSGDSDDLDYLRELMDNGSTIGMDRFGTGRHLSDPARMDVVARLCEEGYAERMILSQDAAFFSISSEPSYRRQIMPDHRHTLVTDVIIPGLRERGVSDAAIEQMMVDNAARILSR